MPHATLSGGKVLIIGALGIVLLLLSLWARGLVHERQQRMEEVVQDIGSRWGGDQVIGGPVLSIPYTVLERVKDESGERTREERRHAHFLPRQVKIAVTAQTEMRARGIYQVPVYGAKLSLEATLPRPDFAALPGEKPAEVLWQQAFLGFQISDVKGIQSVPPVQVGGEALRPESGLPVRQVLTDGLFVSLDGSQIAEGTPVRFEAELNGSRSLQFLPLGEVSEVNMQAPWPAPSFNGAFLPDSHQITEAGFNADWQVLHLNRSFPQQWQGVSQRVSGWEFGVELLEPVDHYLKIHRIVQYAVLFIGVVFLVFLGMEVVNQARVHPVQYALIGLAVLVFYTLLLAFSEHIGFAAGYWIACAAVVGLISAYSRSALGGWQLAAVPGLVLLITYAYMYLVLQLEDYALLAGSIGLFLLLAAAMWVMRKVDWYALGAKPGAST